MVSGAEDNIQTEAVNYVGYYSTHEQSMEAVMHLQASTTESELASIFRKASVHCRRDHLWKSLHDGLCDYSSFTELLKFVHTEEIVMPKLLPFSRQRGLSDSQKWFRLVDYLQNNLQRSIDVKPDGRERFRVFRCLN